jgi:hypothetical protein
MTRRSLHIGIRLRPDLQIAIADEISTANGAIDSTEALHRLALRGAGNSPMYYLASNIGCRRDLEFFSKDLHEFLPRLDLIKSRLAGPLRPILDDPERTENITKWRQLSEDLLPAFRSLFNAANGLSAVLCGMTLDEITQIKDTGLQLAAWLPGRKKKLAEAQEKADSSQIQLESQMIRGYENYLELTQRLLGINY